MSDNDDILEMVVVESSRPRRISFEEESTMPRLSCMCIDETLDPPPSTIHIAKQTSDTCLIHAIVNATQRHDKLGQLLHAIRHVQGLHRKDVTAAVECTRSILNIRIQNGFDNHATIGIAHIYMTCGEGHFISLLRRNGVLHVLDSLNGKMATVKNINHLWMRSTPYTITFV